MDKHLLLAGGGALLVALIVGFAAVSTDIDAVNNNGKAAIIKLSGTITPESGGAFSAAGITPEGVRNVNDQALNRNPDAIIYEINSGGGAVVASKEVMREIESVSVPTVCRFRDVSASGGYLIALGCDRIISDSASLTGSIGVRSSYLQFSGLLERYGVKYVNISSGEYKELGSPYSNITDKEKDILANKTRKIHEEFVNIVDSKRNLTPENLETTRTGEPFLGDRAKEIGLVDGIGGRDSAVIAAENMTGKNLSTFEVDTTPSLNLLNLLTADLSLEQLAGTNKAPLRAEY